MDNKEVIKSFIEHDILNAKALATISYDDNLIENGILDSLSIMKLIVFLENNFGIKINDMDLTPDNFESIDTIQLFLTNKK